ncbi:hypothetical protein ACWGJB_03095 [Streptomyces sp. NPDC054813]
MTAQSWKHVGSPAANALVPLSCHGIQYLFIPLVVRPVYGAAHRLP